MSLAKDIEHIISFKLLPKEAIRYLEQKGYKLTFNYQEMMHEAHHKAFTVAKITRLDLLADIKESLLKALKDGKSFAAWKKDIVPILQKKGWWGKVEASDPKTGEVKTIFVGKRRLKTIFYTNARVAYQVAKAKKYYSDPNVVYLRYIAVLDQKTRPSHRALHGTILPKDDDFWRTHYPPNGWNCRCRVRAVPAHKKVEPTDKSTLPKGAVDPDWAYDVREGRFFDRFSANDVEIGSLSTYKDFGLPSASELDRETFEDAPKTLPKAKNDEEAIKVLQNILLGDKDWDIIQTPITKVLIDKQMIQHIVKDNKDNRERFAYFVLPTLTDPDEIWAVKEKCKDDKYFRKRYRFIKFFKTKKDNAIVIVRLLRDGSLAWTFFKTKDLRYFDKQRVGVLMYFKGR